MRQFGLMVLSVLFLASCHNHSRPMVPANIIEPDSMVAVLTDVHLLQASLQLGYSINDSASTPGKAFKALWKKHHISEADYNRYMQYYSYHPAVLDSIYEKVLNNLTLQKAELMGNKHP